MTPENRSVPSEAARAEQEVRRSRFIADLIPVSDRAAAEYQITQRRNEHPRASHVVYAFILGPARSEISGMSDDGEPKGTAGRPIMEILKGSGLTNTLITVVRYYGGTKLGTGGLVRAYGDAARAVIRNVPRTLYAVLQEFSVTVPYDLHRPVRHLLEEFQAEVRKESFLEQVELVVAVDQERRESLDAALKDLSRGKM